MASSSWPCTSVVLERLRAGTVFSQENRPRRGSCFDVPSSARMPNERDSFPPSSLPK